MHRNKEQEVLCPVCNIRQIEINLTEGDKFAWKCNNCQAIIEGNKPHLLQVNATFCYPRNGGGNICTGFGSRAVAVNHDIYEERAGSNYEYHKVY